MSALPPRKKPGDPILAADWNAMIAALEARTPRPGSGLSMVMTPEGFCYSQPGGHPNIPRQSLPPFSVISITRAEEEGFEVIIKEGWVIERNPKSDAPPAVKFHMPVSGEGEEAIALDTVPRPKIPMNLGDTLWCKIKTDEMGGISEDPPEVVVDSGDQDGTHYQPENPDESGVEGEYFVKLFKLEDNEGKPRVKIYQQSDIEHVAQLWAGENLGAGARVYSGHDAATNKFQFRSVRGDYGIKENEASGEVELDFLAENAGEEEGGEVYVVPEDEEGPLDDPPDGPAQFRKVVGRGYYEGDTPDAGTSGQIGVITDGEVVRVLGNGRTGSRVWKDCDGNEVMRIDWSDGLITSTGDEEMEAGCDGTSSNN